jgi:prepilin-type N-terminal cleavage/methylation domain-containing protein
MLNMSIKKLRTNQGGFTLIELLVVIGILAILLAITLIAINPTKHFQGARNAQRQSDVSAILDGIYEYQAAHSGTVSTNAATATSTPTDVSLGSGIDLCELTPTYLADLPMDPSATAPTGGATPCAAGTTAYDTGYQIAKNNGRFTISAPHAEDGATISVTR